MAKITNVEFLNQIKAMNPVISSVVPNVTESNIDDVYAMVLNNSEIANQFINTLVNVIAVQKSETSDFSQPFKMFKRGFLPMGATYEEVYVDVATEINQDILDPESALGKYVSDIGASYHTINRDNGVFAGTISYLLLRRAFKSEYGMSELATNIIKSLYQGDEKVEYNIFKSLLTSTTIKRSGLPVQVTNPVGAPDQEATAKQFVQTLREYSNLMTFLRNDFNYAMVNSNSPKERQCLIISAALEAVIGVEVLAYAFNMSQVDYMMKRILVDDFGEGSTILAMLVDDRFFIQYDTTYMTNTQYNSLKNWWNYFLHHYGIYSTSLFANAVVFQTNAATTALTITGANTGTRGGTVQLDVTATGYAAHKWSVSGNTSKNTFINMNGLLTIASDETASSLTVTASIPTLMNGSGDTHTVTIS